MGLIFHITPSNIPTNFAYSLIFGLITGNSNIVKVPSKNFEQVTIICRVINKLLKKRFRKLSKMISIVRYSNYEDFTKIYIPYACKLFLQELIAMSIGPRFLTN